MRHPVPYPHRFRSLHLQTHAESKPSLLLWIFRVHGICSNLAHIPRLSPCSLDCPVKLSGSRCPVYLRWIAQVLAGDSTKKTAFSLNSASFFGSRRGWVGKQRASLSFLGISNIFSIQAPDNLVSATVMRRAHGFWRCLENGVTLRVRIHNMELFLHLGTGMHNHA